MKSRRWTFAALFTTSLAWSSGCIGSRDIATETDAGAPDANSIQDADTTQDAAMTGPCGSGMYQLQHQASGDECLPIPSSCGELVDCTCLYASPEFGLACLGGCSDGGSPGTSVLCLDGG